MGQVLTVGEPMVLFVADTVGNLEDVEHFTKYLAGSEVNVAIGLARLGFQVSYVTKLGDDPFGKYINKFLSQQKIMNSNIQFDANNPTGFQIKEKTNIGDPQVVSFRRGSAASHLNSKDFTALDLTNVEHIHLTGIPLALSPDFRAGMFHLAELAKSHSIRLTFDPNLRPYLWPSREEMISTINNLAALCDLVLPGISEGTLLTGSTDPEKIADFYLEKGVTGVIVKLGDQGAFVKTNSESFFVSGFKVEKVVDTVGAGDGFAVGLISGLLEGLSLQEAAKRGNAIGALQVQTPGDNDGLPDREKLAAFWVNQS